MILAIVGSTRLIAHREVFKEVRRFLFDLRPDEVITGGSDGVEHTVMKVTQELGIPFRVYRADVPQWEGETGYKERNEAIAFACDRLIAIETPNPENRSPMWTLQLANYLGKPTQVKIIQS